MSKTYTEEEVMLMMMKAYCAGEQYGITYTGYWVPTTKERSEKASQSCTKIINEADNKK